MTWTPLQHRLHQLPLILAGPILRRIESTPASVTVWLALRQPCQVTLSVYATEYGNGLVIDRLVLRGSRHTVALGQHLHFIAVTATALETIEMGAEITDGQQTNALQIDQADRFKASQLEAGRYEAGRAEAGRYEAEMLQPGQIYAYDLAFETDEGEFQLLQQALDAPEAPLTTISYFEHGLPTFLLPPLDINELKIMHGSCRKTHGGGIDALPIVDDLLEQSASQAEHRPHQLFCTGDQIYGDDVADPWLFALTDAGDTLLGWEETLPIDANPNPTGIPPLKAKHLPPGERTNVAEKLAGFTAGLPNKPDHVNSHLFSLGEYCTAYLFTWSPVLWSHRFPKGEELYRDPRRIKVWNHEVATLRHFFHSLWKVRRALANIATYMIFDDHDVSDDWYLNQTWCMQVLGKPLGRRTVQNGMLAYALCQAWGNTPDQFESGKLGAELLQVAQIWASSGGTSEAASVRMAQLLGLPAADSQGMPRFRRDQQVWILDRHPDSLQWHYVIRSHCHEVVVLDTRTWRGYPIDDHHLAPPMLLSPTAFDQQIRLPLQQRRENLQTLVIAPTNLIHLRIIDWAQELSLKQGNVFGHDVGDAWNLHKEALSELLAALFENRDRVVVLSGDIHYGFAARLNYWTANHHATEQTTEHTEQTTSYQTASYQTANRQRAFQPRELQTEALKTELADEHPKERAQVLVQLTSSAFKNAELKTQIVQTKLKSLLPEPPQEWVGWEHAPQLWEFKLFGLRRRKLPAAEEPLICQIQPSGSKFSFGKVLVSQDADSLPDWHYRIEWIERQAAQALPWGKHLTWLKFRLRQQSRWQRWLGWLWLNRWLQEGKEVVGASNIGMVNFRGFDASSAFPTVSQDLYWCPPWQPDSLVISRFDAELRPAQDARPFPTLR